MYRSLEPAWGGEMKNLYISDGEYVIARNLKAAKVHLADFMRECGYATEEIAEELKTLEKKDPNDTIKWSEDCGYKEAVEIKVQDLIDQNNNGHIGSSSDRC